MHKQYVYLSPIRAQMIYFNYMHNLLNKKMIFYKKNLLIKWKTWYYIIWLSHCNTQQNNQNHVIVLLTLAFHHAWHALLVIMTLAYNFIFLSMCFCTCFSLDRCIHQVRGWMMKQLKKKKIKRNKQKEKQICFSPRSCEMHEFYFHNI